MSGWADKMASEMYFCYDEGTAAEYLRAHCIPRERVEKVLERWQSLDLQSAGYDAPLHPEEVVNMLSELLAGPE